jgi:hypothetical protein
LQVRSTFRSAGATYTITRDESPGLALPILLSATQIVEAVRVARVPWNWLALLVLVDVIAAAAVALSARSLEEVA